jgi:hypothetical protein
MLWKKSELFLRAEAQTLTSSCSSCSEAVLRQAFEANRARICRA